MNGHAINPLRGHRFTLGRTLLLILAALVFFATPSARAQQPAQNADTLFAQAREAEAKKNYQEAWRLLVTMDGVDPKAYEKDPKFVLDVSAKFVSQVRLQLDNPGTQDVLRQIEMLGDARSRGLIAKLSPTGAETLTELLRQFRGIALFKNSNAAMSRGAREDAERLISESLTFLREGDRNYPQALHNHAMLLQQRGMEVGRDVTKRAEAEAILREAVAEFERLYKLEGIEERLRVAARTNLDAIAGTAGVVSPLLATPTSTAAPTPTPEPTLMEKVFGASQGTGSFLDKLKVDAAMQRMILIAVVATILFIVLYWVVPGFYLRRQAKNGDVRAAEAAEKVKFLGFFSFIPWITAVRSDRKTAGEVRRKHGCPHCGFGLDDPFAYEDLVFSRCPKCKGQITPMYSVESLITMLSNSLGTEVERVNSGLASLDKFVTRDSMVRLVRAVITLAVRRRASDLHVEPDERQLVIRQRIDGMMTEMVTLPRSLSMAFVSAIKVTADLNIAEKRKPQDGKMSITVDKTEIDIRIATSPSGAGEKASLRLLDCRSIQLEAKHLGMSPDGLNTFTEAVNSPHGLVLVAGPTGSGKTTTLYVALQGLKTGAKNIISIEDPIEFRIPGVNQIQVNPTAGLTFASGLRSILRQDPDVIMVGEIRDQETAEIAIAAATTGHLVFSTLHTIDSASSVARLIDLGVGPRQFADALSLVIAQRLIRLICQNCVEEYFPTADELKHLALDPEQVKNPFKRGKGCPTCNGTGYFRRMGIFEFLRPSERLRSAIENSKLSTQEIRDLAVAGGMRTMRDESISFLKKGITTAEEVMRMTK